jgi:hypothetical protein
MDLSRHKLYHTTDSGATFTTRDAMESVFNIGFGISAPGLPTV